MGLYMYSRTPKGADLLNSATGGIVSTIRGIRNNNPGNIKISANQWQGKIALNTDGTFEQFDTMANGIRALAVLLKNYQSIYGLNTVDAIIRRWSTTDQDAYVANVAAALGVDPYDSIDATDYDTLNALVTAIITQEDGGAGELLIAATGDIDAGVQAA